MDIVKFGAFLKQLRKEKGFTQEQLAEKLFVTNRTISRWETGRNLPDIDILIELSALYEIDIGELLNAERKAPNTTLDESSLLQKISKYSSVKQTRFMYFVFITIALAMPAILLSIYAALRFMNDVKAGGLVLLPTVFFFLLYCITMQRFHVCKSAHGYLTILTSASIAVILNISFILWLFFPHRFIL